MNRKKIVYSICVDDICNVAVNELGRDLTKTEILEISNKIGDYIDWYQAIEDAINDSCDSTD